MIFIFFLNIIIEYQKNMKKGLLIILSGPSGVGKGTIRQYLMEDKSLNLGFSISCTTRSPRVGEVDGVDYFFVDEETFKKGIEKNQFIEYTQYCDNFYGSSLSYIEKLRNKGLNVIVEIETNGARQLIEKKSDDRQISIFILPPSMESLVERIQKRNSETPESLAKRLNAAKRELELARAYDFNAVNDSKEICAATIGDFIRRKIKELEND